MKDPLGQPLQAERGKDRCYRKKWVLDYAYYSHNHLTSPSPKLFLFIQTSFPCDMTKPALFFFLIEVPHREELVTTNNEICFHKMSVKSSDQKISKTEKCYLIFIKLENLLAIKWLVPANCTSASGMKQLETTSPSAKRSYLTSVLTGGCFYLI